MLDEGHPNPFAGEGGDSDCQPWDAKAARRTRRLKFLGEYGLQFRVPSVFIQCATVLDLTVRYVQSVDIRDKKSS